MKAKKKVVAPKAPNPIDKILHEENLSLLADKATLTSECAMLRSKVLALQLDLDTLNAAVAAEAAGKHKKPGNCKHCGRAKVDHFYYTAKCKPNSGIVFEAAQ